MTIDSLAVQKNCDLEERRLTCESREKKGGSRGGWREKRRSSPGGEDSGFFDEEGDMGTWVDGVGIKGKIIGLERGPYKFILSTLKTGY